MVNFCGAKIKPEFTSVSSSVTFCSNLLSLHEFIFKIREKISEFEFSPGMMSEEEFRFLLTNKMGAEKEENLLTENQINDFMGHIKINKEGKFETNSKLYYPSGNWAFVLKISENNRDQENMGEKRPSSP